MAFKKLDDNDPMPFGEHKGKKMADIPASYLLWYRDNGSPGNVKDYAILNEDTLLEEYTRDHGKDWVNKNDI